MKIRVDRFLWLCVSFLRTCCTRKVFQLPVKIMGISEEYILRTIGDIASNPEDLSVILKILRTYLTLKLISGILYGIRNTVG